MEPGYICGHEGIGTIHEVGHEVRNFAVGDRVIVPCFVSWQANSLSPLLEFTNLDTTSLFCGNECFHCQRGVHGRCKKGDTFGTLPLDGSLAQYFRAPMADTSLYHLPVEADMGELAVLATDIFPTGFNGAKQAFIDTPRAQWKDMAIAFVGCGPVALCAIISAREYNPARIFAIDCNPDRLQVAKDLGCTPVNFKQVNPVEAIMEETGNNGVHAVIEGVGSSPALKTAYDIVCIGGKISSFGVHNGELPFTAAECYNKDMSIRFGRLPLRVVFEDALATLIRNKDLIEKANLIDLVVPVLDESFDDALRRFDRGEVTKVVFKPNGLDV